MPNQTAAADSLARLASAAVALLRQTTTTLAALAEQTAALRVTSTVAGGGESDGATLVADAVLVFRPPGSSADGRYHVRVFQPPGAQPVVVLGELADNKASSIINAVQDLAATVAEVLLDGPTPGSPLWVLTYPGGMFPDEDRGRFESAHFDSSFTDPRWGNMNHDRLEHLAGGPVKAWHVSEYTAAGLRAAGAQVLTPKTRGRA